MPRITVMFTIALHFVFAFGVDYLLKYLKLTFGGEFLIVYFVILAGAYLNRLLAVYEAIQAFDEMVLEELKKQAKTVLNQENKPSEGENK